MCTKPFASVHCNDVLQNKKHYLHFSLIRNRKIVFKWNINFLFRFGRLCILFAAILACLLFYFRIFLTTFDNSTAQQCVCVCISHFHWWFYFGPFLKYIVHCCRKDCAIIIWRQSSTACHKQLQQRQSKNHTKRQRKETTPTCKKYQNKTKTMVFKNKNKKNGKKGLFKSSGNKISRCNKLAICNRCKNAQLDAMIERDKEKRIKNKITRHWPRAWHNAPISMPATTVWKQFLAPKVQLSNLDKLCALATQL